MTFPFPQQQQQQQQPAQQSSSQGIRNDENAFHAIPHPVTSVSLHARLAFRNGSQSKLTFSSTMTIIRWSMDPILVLPEVAVWIPTKVVFSTLVQLMHMQQLPIISIIPIRHWAVMVIH